MDTTSDKNLFFFLLICSVKCLFYFRSHCLWQRHQQWLRKNSRWGRTLKLYLGLIPADLQGSQLLSWVYGIADRILVKTHLCGCPAAPPTLWFQLHQLCGFRWSSSLFTLPTSNTLLSTLIVKEYLQFWRWMAPFLSDPPEIHTAVYGNFQRSDVFHSNRNTFLVQSFCLTVPRWSFPH